MPRRRWQYTESGKPLATPVEVELTRSTTNATAISLPMGTDATSPPATSSGGAVWDSSILDQVERKAGR